MGVTGQVGGNLLSHLVSLKKAQINSNCDLHIRAIVRHHTKGATSSIAAGASSCSIAELTDTKSLTSSFNGSDALFVMLPPRFDPSADFKEAIVEITSLITSIKATTPPPSRVVVLSTVGAHSTRMNLLHQVFIYFEQTLMLHSAHD
jgi:NAD(P)H dehydrogenase (quinone)